MQNTNYTDFQRAILAGIPADLPNPKPYDHSLSHAPKRKDILNKKEKKLALRNALRYFAAAQHAVLAPEFAEELRLYGRIYMYRFRPDYEIKAGKISDYPYQSQQAAAIMLMLHNNLDHAIAQHPHELITYGGNGAVFQNWAQYRLTMQYLAEMTDEQTLALYSGHPMGLFPSSLAAPRVIVTNGMMIPNYSRPDDWEKFNALGVSQYGQMTAGSFMYIGPQGIVHGTMLTVLNAGRMQAKGEKTNTKDNKDNVLAGKIFVTAGLGGMSGAQAKAAVIAGAIAIVAENNPHAAQKRHAQGWVDELHSDLPALFAQVAKAKQAQTPRSFAYVGNAVDLWEYIVKENIYIDLGSDQTSLHNPYAGGYYPTDLSLEAANEMMAAQPEQFKDLIHSTLRRHVDAVNIMTDRGMYFFDYGNAFLKVARDGAKADICLPNGDFKYPSYVQDIMGPLCFDYGFGPFRWVCTSGDATDLQKTDAIAAKVLRQLLAIAPEEIRLQYADNLLWIEQAEQNRLVVGSQARILYADAEARIAIATAFNDALAAGEVSAPIVLGRDHHDVSGTDSPYRETSNIYDGSAFTADMAVQNFVGDAFRGATWVSLHNGGGVGWGEVINGGFGMLIDGSEISGQKIKNMLHWDVNNGIARRSWARNSGAIFAIQREMARTPQLKVTLPNLADDALIDSLDL
jgi:urocanate hydratase